jgi:hypothetical protein
LRRRINVSVAVVFCLGVVLALKLSQERTYFGVGALIVIGEPGGVTVTILTAIAFDLAGHHHAAKRLPNVVVADAGSAGDLYWRHWLPTIRKELQYAHSGG